jgi:hypothetical protein
MAHIQLSEELPGILGPLTFSPEIAPLARIGGNSAARAKHADTSRA